MSHIRLIISDIDGTILNDHHQIDPELAALIPDLKREEIPFVLASARSPKGMAPIAKELGIEDCPMACYNGALIQKGEQVLFEHPIDKNEARQFIDWANQHFPSTAFYLSKANYLEVTAKHVSKEDALVELANHYHLSLEEVLTLGDNFNDLPMLKKAGIGVAMGNAPQEVKDGAAVVTKTNNENGAGQAVETYVLI